ncbi:phosphotransferase [Microbacterium lushaniae]|uniref:Phosphotransferase n=2 Tax=Microbacterium lushaniae TaxID=2614639 RepID=A0A5J6L8W8_9MICO|nr:phosphotransferase [Microbacterium lushaniae]
MLTGGMANAGAVIRRGAVVERPAPSTAQALHAHLLALRAHGFDGAPVPLALTGTGREQLTFLPGDIPLSPHTDDAMTESALASVGSLLRRLHEVSAAVSFDASARWPHLLSDPEGGAILCHNDVCPGNVVFRGGRAVALIDFDMAAPGRPVWDLAMAARYWVPMHYRGTGSPSAATDVARRLRILADGYGLSKPERRQLPETDRLTTGAATVRLQNVPLRRNSPYTWRMSTAYDEPRQTLDEEDLGAQLEKHGVPHQYARGVVDTMLELVSGPMTTALTTSELAFMRDSGVPDQVFSTEAERFNAVYEAASALVLKRDLKESLLPTRAVAQMMGKDVAHVRRLLSEGRLMSAGQVGGQTTYPAWQFVDGEVLPGLRDVLAAFPSDFHPLDIQKVMTSPSEELRGRTPQEWLATGGTVATVVQMVGDLAYL